MKTNSFASIAGQSDPKRERMIDEIRKSRLPVVIYGAGLTAENIFEFLSNKNIPIAGFMVDRGYGENSEFFGLPVRLLDDYISELSSFNIVIGFQNAVRALDNLRRMDSSKIHKIYSFCNFPFWLGLVYDYDFVNKNEAKLTEVYNSLSDDISKQTMLNYVSSIVKNDFDVNIVRDLYDPCQYFPDGIVKLGDEEVFIDCGAYDGDSLKEFLVKAPEGKFKKYYTVEPDDKTCLRMQKFIDELKDARISVVKKGVWDKHEVLRFNSGNSLSSNVSSVGNVDIEVDSIDNSSTKPIKSLS